MRSAMLALALISAAACGGGAGSPGGQSGMDSGDGSGGTGASPGGGSAGSDGASASIERLDESGGAGLVPDRAPPPVSVRRSVPAGSACIGGTSDGTGAVAVGARDASGATSWQAYSADGSPRSLFAADAPLFPESSGWQAIVASGPQGAASPRVEVVAFAPDGAPSRGATVRAELLPLPRVAEAAREGAAPARAPSAAPRRSRPAPPSVAA